MARNSDATRFMAAGFFALRTPLLPHDALCVSEDSAAGEGEPPEVERARGVGRLRELCAREEVKEALFVASPDLVVSLDAWLTDPTSVSKPEKLERALLRYLLRMSSRATPFGLFAGYALGSVTEETRLSVGPVSSATLHTRLDGDYLFALAAAASELPALRHRARYRTNSSLYSVAGQARYAFAEVRGRQRTYHLHAAELDRFLSVAIARAREASTKGELVAALGAPPLELPQEHAAPYVEQLIDAQVLLPELSPCVTGPEQLDDLLTQLEVLEPGLHGALTRVGSALLELDAMPPGRGRGRYLAVASQLEALPVPVSLPRLFQVDMVKGGQRPTLGRDLVNQILEGVDVLHRLSGGASAGLLGPLKEAFTRRYEDRWVPLAEALDDDSGVGAALSGTLGEPSPLLKGLPLGGAGHPESARISALHQGLLPLVLDAARRGADEIELDDEVLERLTRSERLTEPAPLPDAFSVMTTIAAEGPEAMARGEVELWLRSVSGPSGANLLARFCHGDPELAQHLKEHLQAEEALRPDAVFVELCHLPEARLGNILQRPALRAHELVFLGRSGGEETRRVRLDELWMTVRGGRVVLWSHALGREVIPRISSAYNLMHPSSQKLIRFLGALQGQGRASGLSWSWGPLGGLPFLPRVRCGRILLSLATWRLEGAELSELKQPDLQTQRAAVARLREARGLPRHVCVADGDNVLPFDLADPLQLDTFVAMVGGRRGATLTERWPAPEALCARGEDGAYRHEIILPFVRRAPLDKPGRAALRPPDGRPPGSNAAPPGSRWIYFQLYCGAASADRVLAQVVRPCVDQALASGAARRWFFIRYGDPDWHLRLRLEGDPERLMQEVMPSVSRAVAQAMERGLISELKLATYRPEEERYGGPRGLPLCEALFHADSEAALYIVERLDGDAGLRARWLLALRGMDQLMDDLGLELAAKATLTGRLAKGYAEELSIHGAARKAVSDRMREERAAIERILDRAADAAHPLAPGLQALARRSAQSREAAEALRAEADAGRLSAGLPELAASQMHMHANRMLRSSARAHEGVLLDFLHRTYRSWLARARQGRHAGRKA